jgi:hypothetical protein
MGPKAPCSTVLGPEDEAVIVAFRQHTLLPLDNCLHALQPSLPHLTRSSLHRCLRRHGLARLRETDGGKPRRSRSKTSPVGCFHIDIAEVHTKGGRLYLSVAIDRASNFAFTQLHERATRRIAADFLHAFVATVPYQIHTVLTEQGTQFVDLMPTNEKAEVTWTEQPSRFVSDPTRYTLGADSSDELSWVRPGATFTDDGAPNKITSVDADCIRGVSADETWCWSWPGFFEAVRTRRIQHAPGAKRRRAQSCRQRLYLSEAAVQLVEDVSRHPLVVHYGDDLARNIMRTLQALRIGVSVEPPLLIALFHVTHAGAAADGLGPSTAWPKRKGGRRSKLAEAAQETQRLLAHFQEWVMGQGNFALTDLQRIGALAEAGLEAIGALQPDAWPAPGRPARRAMSVQRIHSRLARHWRDHQRKSYRLSDAIRDTAEQEILSRKRVNAGWAGMDPDKVRLDEDDEGPLLNLSKALEIAYHSHPPMTPEQRHAYRNQAAGLLRLSRSATKRTVS